MTSAARTRQHQPVRGLSAPWLVCCAAASTRARRDASVSGLETHTLAGDEEHWRATRRSKVIAALETGMRNYARGVADGRALTLAPGRSPIGPSPLIVLLR
jgi:hypothetical protein